MPKLNVQQNNQNVIKAFQVALETSHDNLLDNAYFVGGGSQLGDGVFPINQRGQTSYSSYQVTIDRWTLFGGSVVLAADGITVTSSPDFGQVLEPSRLPVGTYTASVKTADGKIGSITFTTTGSQFYAGGAMGDTGVTLNFIDLWASDKTLFSLQCQGVKIAAAKLEKGTVSTLPNDIPPDFRDELRKCQRYLRDVSLKRTPCYFDGTYSVAVLTLTGIEMAKSPTPSLITAGFAWQPAASASANLTATSLIAFEQYTPTIQFPLSVALSGMGMIYDTVVRLSCEL